MLTAWDGHARVDYLGDSGTLQVTLMTLEPVAEAELREGLIVGFAATDPFGPPVFLGISAPRGVVPSDVHALLGPVLTETVAAALRDPGTSRWTRLDLADLDDLAAAWAPYRSVVHATMSAGADTEHSVAAPEATSETARSAVDWRGAIGTWAGELWTALGGPAFQDAVRAALSDGGGLLVFRDQGSGGLGEGEASEGGAGEWEIASEIAERCGIERRVQWRFGVGGRLVVLARLTARPATHDLYAGFGTDPDDWYPFEETSDGRLFAELFADRAAAPVALRLRTRARSSR